MAPIMTGSTLTPAAGIALFDRWTALWNGDLSEPERFLAPGFRIRFGNSPEQAEETDSIRGPQVIVDRVAAFRAARPGLRYTVDGTPLVDTVQGTVASRWYVSGESAADGAAERSGIDLFEVVDGRIATVWSVTGLRRFAH